MTERARARYRCAPFRESASPLTISHTIRPNDWHPERLFCSLSSPLSLSLSLRGLIRHSKKSNVATLPASWPVRLDQKSSCKSRRVRARRASEHLAARMHKPYIYSHTNVDFSPECTSLPFSPRGDSLFFVEACFTFSFSSSLCKRHLFHAALALLVKKPP